MRDIPEYYEQYEDYVKKIDEMLYEFLNSDEILSAGKHKGCDENIYEPIKYLLNAGGKRIRPVLLILCCELCGGEIEDSIDAAIAIEMLHNFTLVHDDIMDNADKRRGLETIHKKWSVNTAILSGDALLALSYKALLNTKNRRIQEIVIEFTNGVIQVCEGQAMDKEFEINNKIGVNDYLVMIKKKTSELVKTCASIGGLTGNANNEQILSLKNYAENIGLAFQIQDDLLDVYSTEKKFGKKPGGDITEKKKTFLYLTALNSAGDDERDRLKDIYNSVYIDPIQIEAVIDIYNKSGVIGKAKSEIRRFTNEALKYIDTFENNEKKAMLKWFSDMLLNRTY